MNQPLLRVDSISKSFDSKGSRSRVRAVDGVSLQLFRGQTIGIVGESGSGKSTLGRLMLRLIEPTSGSVIFDGSNLNSLEGKELRKIRREMQMIFQDPLASLDPRMSVQDLIMEPLVIHKIGNRKEQLEMVRGTLGKVGLSEGVMENYPHEFSGGQRQRISIARAIIAAPKLIVADEPVSALDVSIQSQILNLILDLKHELNLTYVFISHDLGVVEHIADMVAVMYLGKVVEFASTEDIFSRPKHPYTQALISSIPQMNPSARGTRVMIKGDIPSPRNPPSGCHFHPRCPQVMAVCSEVTPVELSIPSAVGYEAVHLVSCHLYTSEKSKS